MAARERPLDPAAGVLDEQHSPELLEAPRGIFERADDRLPLVDPEAHDLDAAAVGVLEATGQVVVVDQAGEFGHEFVADVDAGELRPPQDGARESESAFNALLRCRPERILIQLAAAYPGGVCTAGGGRCSPS